MMTDIPFKNMHADSRSGLTPPEADRLLALGTVAGELMHDLANVLAVAHGRASLALGDLQDGRDPKQELERTVESTRLMGDMLRDALGTLCGAAVPADAFSVAEVVERAVQLCEIDRVQVDIRTTLPDGVRVVGRASFLVRAIQNLLGNAARHAAERVEIRLRIEDGEAVLEVADDGPGLPAGATTELFQPLRQGANAGAMGLGLSSARWAAEQLRAVLECGADPRLGGAAFRLRMPAMLPVSRAGPSDLLAGYRLALVESDPAVARAVGRLLERMGATVAAIEPGTAAGDELLRAVIAATPDAVLLDLGRGGHDGVAVWNTLRAALPALAERVVFISGDAPGEAGWERARTTGQPIVPKPLDAAVLARVIVDLVTRN